MLYEAAIPVIGSVCVGRVWEGVCAQLRAFCKEQELFLGLQGFKEHSVVLRFWV